MKRLASGKSCRGTNRSRYQVYDRLSRAKVGIEQVAFDLDSKGSSENGKLFLADITANRGMGGRVRWTSRKLICIEIGMLGDSAPVGV
jgi:hypothetical protein